MDGWAPAGLTATGLRSSSIWPGLLRHPWYLLALLCLVQMLCWTVVPALIDPAPPGAGALAYDKAGAIVATVYVRPLRAVTEKGFDDIGPTARPISHVSVYPYAAGGVQPEVLVTIVLWHISPASAALLK